MPLVSFGLVGMEKIKWLLSCDFTYERQVNYIGTKQSEMWLFQSYFSHGSVIVGHSWVCFRHRNDRVKFRKTLWIGYDAYL